VLSPGDHDEEAVVPVYQYACTECGHQLEARQSFSDDPLTVCPECDGRLRKVLSAVGVVFKGSGFYRTDSRKEPAGAGAGASSGTTKDSSGGSGATGGSDGSSGSTGSASSTSTTASGSGSSSSSSSAAAAS
jgi:putative FmdB family regulatory protein